jgi:hypothetical protein
MLRTYEGNFEALTMFVDVSGFTPMTQALMKHGHEGADHRIKSCYNTTITPNTRRLII